VSRLRYYTVPLVWCTPYASCMQSRPSRRTVLCSDFDPSVVPFSENEPKAERQSVYRLATFPGFSSARPLSSPKRSRQPSKKQYYCSYAIISIGQEQFQSKGLAMAKKVSRLLRSVFACRDQQRWISQHHIHQHKIYRSTYSYSELGS
jgi:hypothetical protein